MDLKKLDLTALLEKIDKKELSVKEIVGEYLSSIDKKDTQIRAYTTMRRDLANDEFDDYNGKQFRGLPLAIKDNFCTRGLRTTASALILDEFIPPYDSTVTSRLKDAGFTFLGKTNLDAWAHGSSTEASDYGATHNPLDLSKSPGGSSGGSAAAVIGEMAPASIGSETAGSIRLPASWCGVVGLKPTYGRVSRYGVIAMGSSLDCPGPITKSVRDSALLLKIIAGKDPYDATSIADPVDDYVKIMKENRKFTIGISDEYFEGVDKEVANRVNEIIMNLEKDGHTIKKVSLLSPQYSISVYTIIQRAEVSSNLARYTGLRYGKTREHFGKEAKKRTLLGTYTLSQGFYDQYYNKAQKVRTLIIDDFKKAFNQVDVIVAPTTPITAIKLGEWEKYPFFGEKMDVLSEPSSIAGIPGISIPVGNDSSNMPIGLQIIGNYVRESDVINLGYQIEQMLK